MPNITVIPARRQVRHSAKEPEKPKLKVAAYCRVSTDRDEQATSYEAQVEHYTDYINKNSDWELAGVYADDGISGTNTKKREEFNRMIEDCMTGKIDMVITKSISRFARNTLDCLKYIRQLKDKGISVYFEKENINTLDAKGEVLLTIMASLAQQESQSLSQNVRLGIQFRYQQGKVQVCANRFLGYDKDEDGNLVINQEEAKIVKRIYREYLEGASLLDICNSLMADGILTGAHKKKWIPSTVKKILTNEKYIGDALLQKTVTVDFLTKKRVANTGIVPQYYVEGCQEAIISKETFMMVQEEMAHRANMYSGKSRKRRVYSSKYALSSIVICPNCGDIYRRISWDNRGKHSIVWRCVNRVEHGPKACNAPTVKEEVLKAAVIKAINETLGQKSEIIARLKKSAAKMLSESSADTTKIDVELERLQQAVLKRSCDKQSYDELTDQILQLREKKNKILLTAAEEKGQSANMSDLAKFLESQDGLVHEFDEVMVRRLVKNVYVQTENSFIIEFKSGTKVSVVVE